VTTHTRAWPVIALLVLVPLVCWTWIVVMARDMYGPMTGASAWMMTPVWDAPHLMLLWAMWAVMMTAMMLPSAAPIILLGRRGGHPYFLAVGYVLVWALFSVGATILQWLLGRLLILTPMMEVSSRQGGAVLLALAGLYQWTPLKRTCLTTCQSPMAFLTRRWRSGRAGAFRMGVEHGIHCVGCCWALMLLLFAGGVMNLAVIAALTVFVAFEKLVPLGVWTARVSGAVLVMLAVWMGMTTLLNASLG
jgi:predicted metal-binding membrane protein